MATYQEQTTGTPEFYNQMWQQLVGKGQTLAGQQMTQPPPAQTVAGFTPQQQQAFDLAGQQVGSYQPWLQSAAQFAQQAGQGATFDPTQLQQYMNPYTQSVVGEIGRLGQERFQQELVPGITGAMGGLGQFGSARTAAMLADAAGRSQREILGQQSSALQSGYNQAMQNYQNWTQMGLGAGQTAATQMGNLAQALQQLQTGDIGALTTAGALQQQQAQRVADLPFLNWQQRQAYPWQALNQWANLFKAGTPTSGSSFQTTFKKGGLARYKKGGPIRYADGGTFSWQVSPNEQAERDEMRKALLLEELRMDPTNPDLLEEISRMGGISADPSLLSMEQAVPAAITSAPIGQPPVIPAAVPGVSDFSSDLIDMAKRAAEERYGMLQRVRGMPEFAPVEQEGWMGRAGEAMLRAAAEGPANIGQMIGRAGTAYFDKADAIAAENKRRALERLAIEEKLVPDIPRPLAGGRVAGRAGGQPTPEQLRTVYNSARNEAAQIAKDYKFESADERTAWIEQEANKSVQNYIDQFATQPLGPRGRTEAPTPGATPAQTPALASGEAEAAPIPVTPPDAPARPTGQIIPPPRDRAEEERTKVFSVETEKAALKDYNETVLPASRIAESTLNMVSTLRQIPRTQDRFAPWRQELGSWLHAIGVTSDNLKMVGEAENLQQVRPILARIANERLLLAKGTQTEGDAERAYNEFIKIGDTQKAADFMLAWAEELAHRDKFKKQLYEEGAAAEKTWAAGSRMWDQSDYGQTAPVAIIDGEIWNFTEFREQAVKANPEATISQIIDKWNSLARRESPSPRQKEKSEQEAKKPPKEEQSVYDKSFWYLPESVRNLGE